MNRAGRAQVPTLHAHASMWDAGMVLCVLLIAWWPSVSAIVSGWWPLEDDAKTAVKIQDLLKGHLPLTGAQATTGQVDPLLSAHHLGPIEFYLMAPLVAIDSRVGLLVGAAVIHTVALVLVVRASQRLGGLLLAVPMLAGCALLAASLEYARLFQPVNTVPPTFFLVLLPLSGILVIRHRVSWLPAFVLSATVVSQGQLAYAPVTALICFGVAVVGLRDWRLNRGSWWPVPGWPQRRSPAWRPGWVAVVLTLLMCAPLLWEALTFAPSNVAQLWRYLRATEQRAPVAERPGLWEYLADIAHPSPSAWAGALGSAALVAALILLSHTVGARSPLRRRREERWRDPAYLLPAVALGGYVVESLILASALPTGPGVWTTAYWVTPLAAFRVLAWACVFWLGARWLRGRLASWFSPSMVQGTAVATGGAVLAASLLWFLPGSADYDSAKNKVVSTPGAQVLPDLRQAAVPGSPVRVTYTGGFFYTPVYPTAYRLMGEGWFVCTDFTWPLPEETDFRAWAACPADSPIVVVTRAGESLAGRPELAEGKAALVGTSEAYIEGDVSVAYDTYLITFSKAD